MRPNVFHGVILILVLGAGLFFLKHTVEEKERSLVQMKSQYLKDQKTIRVLKAEWTYLNSPKYLQSLSRQYLTVQPISSGQVVAWSDHFPHRFLSSKPVSYAYGKANVVPDERAMTSAPPKPGRGDEP